LINTRRPPHEPEKGDERNHLKKKMIVPRIAIFALLVLSLTPFYSWGNSLPQSIGPLALVKLQSGEEARKEIDRLHGKPLGYREGYIGTYADGDGKAKLWVSEYSSLGMGQAHYFFQKGVKVIWLAVDPPLAKQAIRDLLGEMP
jgi:hypothetical protein